MNISVIKLILFAVIGAAYQGYAQNLPAQCFSDPKAAYQFLLTQSLAHSNSIININTATEADFLTLDGVGVKTAQAIVAYRSQVGRFEHIEDLMKVKGIGQKTFLKNKARLTVQ